MADEHGMDPDAPTAQWRDRIASCISDTDVLLLSGSAPAQFDAAASLRALLKSARLSVTLASKHAGVSREYLQQTLRGARVPGRNALIRLGFVMHLTTEKTNQLLDSFQRERLYAKDSRDMLVIFALSKGYTLEGVEALLTRAGEASLYEGAKVT